MSDSVVLPAAFRRAARLAAVPLLSGGLLAGGLVTAPMAQAAPTVRAASASTSSFTPFGYGARGAKVVFVQRVLHVRQTGYFGPLTRTAVRRFQSNARIRVTGVVDARTWRGLVIWSKRQARTAPRTKTGSAAFSAKVLRAARTTASGARYVRGATGPKRFDCSGYVGYVYRRAAGVSLPRTSRQMRSATRRISSSQLRPGDLVFVYNGGGGRVGHVAIYAGGGKWWEASNPRTGVGLHKAWSRNVSYGRA